jgi:GTP cyclohydrolase II
MTLVASQFQVNADGLPAVGECLLSNGVRVEVYSRAVLPTRHGEFAILVFRTNIDHHEHVALVKGHVRAASHVAVRLHSECMTGDVFGSLRCDCQAQLNHAQEALGNMETGILLYLRQEGRGIGLGNKIRAYALQEAGLDTVEANQHLGFDDDLRDYRVAGLMLRLLAPASIQLLTNNPRKVLGLKEAGINVSARVPLVVGQTKHNAHYLATKAKKSGHLLPMT